MLAIVYVKYVCCRGRSGPEVVKLVSYPGQLSIKIQLLVKTEMLINDYFSCFLAHRYFIYPAHKCKNANKCCHFNIHKHDKFHADLS